MDECKPLGAGAGEQDAGPGTTVRRCFARDGARGVWLNHPSLGSRIMYRCTPHHTSHSLQVLAESSTAIVYRCSPRHLPYSVSVLATSSATQCIGACRVTHHIRNPRFLNQTTSYDKASIPRVSPDLQATRGAVDHRVPHVRIQRGGGPPRGSGLHSSTFFSAQRKRSLCDRGCV